MKKWLSEAQEVGEYVMDLAVGGVEDNVGFHGKTYILATVEMHVLRRQNGITPTINTRHVPDK